MCHCKPQITVILFLGSGGGLVVGMGGGGRPLRPDDDSDVHEAIVAGGRTVVASEEDTKAIFKKHMKARSGRVGTVLIGYYDYLGTRTKNSHRPIIVTGR